MIKNKRGNRGFFVLFLFEFKLTNIEYKSREETNERNEFIIVIMAIKLDLKITLINPVHKPYNQLVTPEKFSPKLYENSPKLPKLYADLNTI